MHKPKIYVSGPSRDLERCEAAIALCIELGAEITYDWTVDVRANTEPPSDPDAQRTIALVDLDGTAAADVMVFLDADHPSPGRWVEVGAAWGRGVPILASIPVGCRPYIWHQLMECTTSDESAIYRAVILGRKRAAVRARSRFRQARERAGLSLAQATKLTGLDIAWIETGTHSLSPSQVEILARAYRVTACWLSGHDAPVDLTGLAEQAQDKGVSPGDFAEIATMAQTLAVCAACHTDAVSSAP